MSNIMPLKECRQNSGYNKAESRSVGIHDKIYWWRWTATSMMACWLLSPNCSFIIPIPWKPRKNPIPIPLYLVCLKPFITPYAGVPPSLPLYFTLNPFFWDLKWPSRPPPLICLSSSFASFSRRSLRLIPISWLMSLTLISLPSWVSWPLFVCLVFSQKGKGREN